MDADESEEWIIFGERQEAAHHRVWQEDEIADFLGAESGEEGASPPWGVDRLMATVNDDPHYHFRNGPARGEFHGRDAVRTFYEGFAASGATKLQVDTYRLVADRYCIITEGVQRIAFPAATLAMRGITVDDPSADYLFEAWSVTIWPFDEDGKLIGEDAYYGGDGFRGIEQRKVQPGDVLMATSP